MAAASWTSTTVTAMMTVGTGLTSLTAVSAGRRGGHQVQVPDGAGAQGRSCRAGACLPWVEEEEIGGVVLDVQELGPSGPLQDSAQTG